MPTYIVTLTGTKQLHIPASTKEDALNILNPTYHGWTITNKIVQTPPAKQPVTYPPNNQPVLDNG